MAAELKLTEQELDDAVGLIRNTRYSYYFPPPFEFDALLYVWDRARPALAKTNLLSYEPHTPLELTAPKNKYVVRPIQLLDPVDLIYLTGLTLRLAPRIETRRLLPARSIVHSYRFRRDPAGGAQLHSDYDAWVSEVRERASSNPVAARADIVDFFPRVYVHRLENALTALTGQDSEVRAIMHLLDACSHGTSYGIPVGPVACSYLAEALLAEVDDYLVSHGVSFTRYIDDYAIFGQSEAECLRALFVLGQRLHSTQGLSLNMAKTRVMKADALASEMTPPEARGSPLKTRIFLEVLHGDPYTEIDPEKLTREEKVLLDELDTQKILDVALAGDIVDLREVKFVLTILSGLRRAEQIDRVIGNLDRLAAASEVVAKFLDAVEVADSRERIERGRKILEFVRSGRFVPDFQAMWLLEPFVRSPRWGNLSDLRVLAREHKNRLVRRQAALAVGCQADRSALLDLKSGLDDMKDWEWRSTLFACRNLPKDEAMAFYQQVGGKGEWTPGNVVTRATVAYARSQPLSDV